MTRQPDVGARRGHAAALLAMVAIVVVAARADAEPLAAVVRTQLEPVLPTGTTLTEVHLPAGLAALDVDAADVIVEPVRALRIGRRSVKLRVRGRRATFVAVAIARLGEVAVAVRPLAAGATISPADVRIEARPLPAYAPSAPRVIIGARVTRPIAEGAAVSAADIVIPPPVARGTEVTVELVRGGVHVRSTGTLELVAQVGGPATVRLGHSGATVRGTLTTPSSVVLGGAP